MNVKKIKILFCNIKSFSKIYMKLESIYILLWAMGTTRVEMKSIKADVKF